MDVLITDIDGVLANTREREQRAMRLLSEQRPSLDIVQLTMALKSDKELKKIFYSAEGLFNPDWVKKDVPTESAHILWLAMQYVDYTIILTGRPDWLQVATKHWLQDHKLWNEGKMSVVCKDYGSRVKYLTHVEWFEVMVGVAKQCFDNVSLVSQVPNVLQAVEPLVQIIASGVLDMTTRMQSREVKIKHSYTKEMKEAFDSFRTR